MTSVLTNRAALSAVSALAATQRALAETQNQMTTGLKVASAKDDAAYWSIATSMQTRIGNLHAANDDLDVTSAVISTTQAALTNILGLVQKMSSLVVSAQTAGVDVPTIQSQIAQLQKGIIATADAASVNGVNWLVTKVVGTSTTTETSTFDLSLAADQAIRAHGGDGVEHETVTDGVDEHVVRTLASSSATDQTRTSSTNFTLTGQTITHQIGQTISHVHTLTDVASNPTSTASSSGDANGYQIGTVPISVSADGTVIYSSYDFHNTELFQSFSGASGATYQQNYADQTTASSDPTTPKQAQEPYFTGTESDLLDTPFLSAAGQTNILQMDLTNAQDAASAAPAIDAAISGITKGLTFLGGMQNQVDGSKTINSLIIGALTLGIGSLVDADMDKASTRLAALKTQQQLSVQALSIANDNATSILKLFAS